MQMPAMASPGRLERAVLGQVAGLLGHGELGRVSWGYVALGKG